jgi:hypothetical protein
LLQSCEVESKYYNARFENQIVSLKSDKSLKGGFVLGSGSIEEIDYYYFFIKDTLYNGYKKHKIKSLETLIIEKDTTPTFIKNKAAKVKTIKYLFGEDKIETEYYNYGGINQFLTGIEIPKKIKYINILIVPKGVITKNIKWEAL